MVDGTRPQQRIRVSAASQQSYGAAVQSEHRYITCSPAAPSPPHRHHTVLPGNHGTHALIRNTAMATGTPYCPKSKGYNINSVGTVVGCGGRCGGGALRRRREPAGEGGVAALFGGIMATTGTAIHYYEKNETACNKIISLAECAAVI
jgi:hypothetical protein